MEKTKIQSALTISKLLSNSTNSEEVKLSK